MEIISFNNLFKSFVLKDTIKITLDFQLRKIHGNRPKLNSKKVYNFLLTDIGTKRKAEMNGPIETVIIKSREKCDLHDVLNPVDIL